MKPASESDYAWNTLLCLIFPASLDHKHALISSCQSPPLKHSRCTRQVLLPAAAAASADSAPPPVVVRAMLPPTRTQVTLPTDGRQGRALSAAVSATAPGQYPISFSGSERSLLPTSSGLPGRNTLSTPSASLLLPPPALLPPGPAATAPGGWMGVSCAVSGSGELLCVEHSVDGVAASRPKSLGTVIAGNDRTVCSALDLRALILPLISKRLHVRYY
jgi:hypothetical protein